MDLSPIKRIITEEETKTGAAVSEATAQKLGQSINFFGIFYDLQVTWTLNGPYARFGSTQISIDGQRHLTSGFDVVGISFGNSNNGTAGFTEFDIIRHKADNTGSSTIFSVKPKLSFQDGNDQWYVKNFSPVAVLHSEPNATNPTLSVSTFDPGDMLTLNLTSVMANASNANLSLYLKAKNTI